MLNPNPRTNTVISQSFIASEFQGFNDPFVRSEPTSSLNQFIKSKQVSDSGMFNQDLSEQSNQQSFGFGNITKDTRQSESFTRKSNENVQINVQAPTQQQTVNYQNQAYQEQQQFNPQYGAQNVPQQANFNRPQQQQFPNQMIPPQKYQERYVSPQISKPDSPVKNNPQFYEQQEINRQQYVQQEQRNSTSQVQPALSESRQQYQASNLQQSRTEQISQPQQYSQKQLEGSKVEISQTGEGSTIGKRLKLNISQEFSNSFVLKCVNEPQKSTILQMKQRQREYRKSIRNFFG